MSKDSRRRLPRAARVSSGILRRAGAETNLLPPYTPHSSCASGADSARRGAAATAAKTVHQLPKRSLWCAPGDGPSRAPGCTPGTPAASWPVPGSARCAGPRCCSCPTRLHLLMPHSATVTPIGLPLGDQRPGFASRRLPPIPALQHASRLSRPCPAARAVPASCCCARCTLRRTVVLDHVQPVTSALDVVALAGHHLPLRLPLLLLRSPPCCRRIQPSRDITASRTASSSSRQRSRHPHPTVGG